ncbi:alkane 1-monooxygenase [Algimonas arctica]|uniref:Luciferase-like monooxygenase n=1 Tax=Algimonas arctica TaxID=1479486 RepID=A0A8J3CSZ7_9PROT|nr:LLM class flavin-dependent oxidoreductase [Algimonas arctica]GHB02755.1 alkane 1-monooxygenase [Algimonas arctica]
MPIPFSILDLAQVVEGGSISKSFADSVELAQKAEALGYNRVWYAEHHNIKSVASSATSVLIAHIAAQTKTIRLGAGGIMLPNHAPLLIAEQFGTLATLHPDRIDLGLGRAPGGDMGVIRAMRKDYERAAQSFPTDVQELIGYLSDPVAGENPAVRAIPGEGTKVPVWILGSSLFGAQLAARLGLPYAFASHFAPGDLFQAAEIYRRTFVPSRHLDKPYFMMACNVFAADTEEDAQYHFSTLVQAFVGIITNQRGLTCRPVKDFEVPPHVKSHVEAMLQVSAVGTVDMVAERLSMFNERLQPDEIIIAKNFHDQNARLRSLELTIEVQARMAHD